MRISPFLRVLCVAAIIATPVRVSLADDTTEKPEPSKPAAVPEKKAEDASPATQGKKDDLTPIKLDTDENKLAYMIGCDVGNNLKQKGIAVVNDRFLMGYDDISKGKDPAMTDEEINSVLRQYQEKAGPPQISPDGTPVPAKPITGDDKFLGQLSYIFGADIATSLHRNGLVLNMDTFMRAIDDVKNDRPLALSEEQRKQVADGYRQKQMEKRKAAADKNLADGKAFLAENAKKPGIKTTASGLQYLVVAEGKGEMPKATDTVKAHYRGTLLDGTEFDSSYKRNEPLEIPVEGVIPGWTEALQLMHVGDKWKLFIPSELAYGERGAGPDIGPNSTLIFDIELLEIVKKQKEDDGSAGTISLDAGTGNKPAGKPSK